VRALAHKHTYTQATTVSKSLGLEMEQMPLCTQVLEEEVKACRQQQRNTNRDTHAKPLAYEHLLTCACDELLHVRLALESDYMVLSLSLSPDSTPCPHIPPFPPLSLFPPPSFCLSISLYLFLRLSLSLSLFVLSFVLTLLIFKAPNYVCVFLSPPPPPPTSLEDSRLVLVHSRAVCV